MDGRRTTGHSRGRPLPGRVGRHVMITAWVHDRIPHRRQVYVYPPRLHAFQWPIISYMTIIIKGPRTMYVHFPSRHAPIFSSCVRVTMNVMMWLCMWAVCDDVTMYVIGKWWCDYVCELYMMMWLCDDFKCRHGVDGMNEWYDTSMLCRVSPAHVSSRHYTAILVV